jgi:hypothetical protein
MHIWGSQRSESGYVRVVARAAATDYTIEICPANGRPHAFAARFPKPLGFDGTKALDIEATGVQLPRLRIQGRVSRPPEPL